MHQYLSWTKSWIWLDSINLETTHKTYIICLCVVSKFMESSQIQVLEKTCKVAYNMILFETYIYIYTIYI